MAKKEVKMNEECCLTCANLLTCPDILTYRCKGFEKGKIGDNDVTGRYLETLEKVKRLINDLVIAVNDLALIGTEQKVAKRVAEKEPEQSPAISKRNKEITKLKQEGRPVEEIAKKLGLERSTVQKEIEYLTKAGILKASKTEDRQEGNIPKGITEKQFENMLKDTKMTREDWETLPTHAKESMLRAVQKESVPTPAQ